VGDTVRSHDGVAIGTMTEGEGPPLLLVHGGMRAAANWAPLWPLRDQRRATSRPSTNSRPPGVSTAESATSSP
jgi:pimeloyl-ACP methyl ester carboxylesterase